MCCHRRHRAFCHPKHWGDTTLATLRTGSSNGDRGSPDGTSIDIRPVKGVVLAILVLHAYQTMTYAIDGSAKKRRGAAEITVGDALRRGELPGVAKRQDCGAHFDQRNGNILDT